MGIRRLTLAGSLCVVLACGSDDSPQGAGGPDTPAPSLDAGVFPAPASTAGGATAGFFGGATLGGAGALGGLFGGAGGFVGPGFPPGFSPARLTEMHKAERPPHAISGGTLAVMADGSYAVAADPDLDTLYIVDTANLTVKKLALPVGSEPGRIVLDATGDAHVVLRQSGELLRVNLASASAAGQARLCSQARGLVYDAARDTLVAACMDGDVVMLRPGDYREISRTHVAPDLRDVVLSRGGRLFATRYRSAELIALDAAGAVQATTRPRQARISQFDFGPPPVATPTAIVLPAGEPVQREVTFSPTLAWRAATAADGGLWMLHQQSQDDEVRVTAGGYGGAAPCGAITRGAVTRFTEDGAPLLLSGIMLHGTSVDLAASPKGDFVAIASPGGFLLGAQTLQVYATSDLGDNMNQGDCVGPRYSAGDTSQVVAVAFDAQGLLYSFSREPVEFEIFSPANSNSFSFARLATLTLDRRSNRDTGHELFHADVGTGLACASCHGEALDDGHVWTFAGIGPRRTQNMRGGLLATAPFHWDGDMVNFKKLVDDVMTGRMGGFPVNDQQADALAHWIDAQPALLLPGGDAAAIARGKALFEGSTTACASCHSGDALTNNESADVGTGGSFQVPSLRGLGMRAPYMHNGCAKTLEARFDAACGGGDKHGKTSQLSTAQIADLSAYLRSL